MANSQDEPEAQHPDLLAAVVLHVLVSQGDHGMTIADVARACERDPDDADDAKEMLGALDVLLEDGLAEVEGKTELVRPTRAAVRANELSF